MLPETEVRRLLTELLGGLHLPVWEEGFAPETAPLPRVTWELRMGTDGGEATVRVWCADHAGCVAALEALRGLIPFPGVLLRSDSGCLALTPAESRAEWDARQPPRAMLRMEVTADAR